MVGGAKYKIMSLFKTNRTKDYSKSKIMCMKVERKPKIKNQSESRTIRDTIETFLSNKNKIITNQ